MLLERNHLNDNYTYLNNVRVKPVHRYCLVANRYRECYVVFPIVI